MNLRKFREALGLKQFELAEQLGMSAGVVCSIEKGTRFPEPATILKIMQFSAKQNNGRPRVTANDILQTWCKNHGEVYPAG
jgi:predicted transcriptional regulator